MPENTPKVICGSAARDALKAGFNQLARLLALTLGPTQGIVLNSSELKPAPEPISDAATIARRITELPERSQEVGAMLLRNLVWRVHLRVGDGSATTAVLAQAMLEHASRFVTAGANPALIQQGMQRAARQVVACLQELAVPVTMQEQLASVAYTATREPELSFLLSELFDLLGEHAHVEIEDYMAPYLEREYINGGVWQARLVSPYLISAPASGKAIGRDCQVVLFNGNLSQTEEILPLLELLNDQQQKNLLLVAQKITGEALNTLVATYQQNKEKLQFVVVELVRAGDKALGDMQDLALLTGARLFNPEAGDRLTVIQKTDLGQAQRAEASPTQLFVTGGKGDPAALRTQIHALHTYLGSLDFDDERAVELKLRLGRLSGSSGILKIGAYGKHERQILHQKARQGVQALHAALQAGVLPGGGTAYLHCIPAVEKLACSSEDERMGCLAVAHALRKPFEQLLKNAGIPSPGSLSHEIMKDAPGMVYDLQNRQLRPAADAGVLDAAQVLVTCLETAASGAQMAISTDVLLLKRNPRVTYEP